MSWYTNFYLAYQTKEGKIYPYGPFDYKNDYKCIHSTSRSFTTELKNNFDQVTEDQLSKELIDNIYGIDISELDICNKKCMGVCKVSDLPKENDFIKSGYFLIRDIKQYKEDNDSYNLFYERLDPDMYIIKLENEQKFGIQKEAVNEYGETYTPHQCRDYTYFMYPDYNCMEYELFKIKLIINTLDGYLYNIPEGAEMVIFKTEG